MPWFRVDDNLGFHHKVIAAGNPANGPVGPRWFGLRLTAHGRLRSRPHDRKPRGQRRRDREGGRASQEGGGMSVTVSGWCSPAPGTSHTAAQHKGCRLPPHHSTEPRSEG